MGSPGKFIAESAASRVLYSVVWLGPRSNTKPPGASDHTSSRSRWDPRPPRQARLGPVDDAFRQPPQGLESEIAIVAILPGVASNVQGRWRRSSIIRSKSDPK